MDRNVLYFDCGGGYTTDIFFKTHTLKLAALVVCILYLNKADFL